MPASAQTVTAEPVTETPRPRWRRRLGTAAMVVALAVALTAGAIAIGDSGEPSGATHVVTAADAPLERLANADIADVIAALQAHLRAEPKDAAGWSTLGAAYVEQARTNGDPTRYPQAEEAFDRSMTIQRNDNDAALAGRAALAAARHDFPTALRNADRALAINPYSERALAIRIDALVELGRYDDAFGAAKHADALKPGIPIFTRYAYVLELRGDPAGARRVLEQALGSAVSPGDIAYVTTALGQLAWTQGQYATAMQRFNAALKSSPSYIPALDGRGRTYAAQGDLDDAAKDLAEVVRRYPLPRSSPPSARSTRPRATASAPCSSTGSSPPGSSSPVRTVSPPTSTPPSSPPTTATARRPSTPPAPNGSAATASTQPTPSPGPCTSTATTRKPSATRRPLPRPATATRSSCTTAA